jgi:hypothetical protein|tara:strand:- start:236 stop:484 length:249 start_codon:yes stop_codon:yes gene_type:complete
LGVIEIRAKINNILENDWVKSFIFYSIFRAFYGAGILIITWIFATESQAPIWVSIIFLLCSMVFSRILLKKIKEFSSRDKEN